MDEPFQIPLTATLAEAEIAFARAVLAASGGNISEAARRLGVARRTLQRKLASAR